MEFAQDCHIPITELDRLSEEEVASWFWRWFYDRAETSAWKREEQERLTEESKTNLSALFTDS